MQGRQQEYPVPTRTDEDREAPSLLCQGEFEWIPASPGLARGTNRSVATGQAR